MKPQPLILVVETASRIGSVALAEGPQILAETTFSAPLTHSAEIFPTVQQLLSRSGHSSRQIEHLYVSIGPGSFTGLRIAVSIAKMMHLANHTQIVAVDTLDTVAANVIDLLPRDQTHTVEPVGQTTDPKPQVAGDSTVAAILDAKRGQFFIAAYGLKNADTAPAIDKTCGPSCEPQATGYRIWQKVLPDSLMSASQFLETFAPGHKPLWLLGDGLLHHKDKFQADGIHFFDEKFWSPTALNVFLLGHPKALAGQFADATRLTPNYLLRPDVKIKTP